MKGVSRGHPALFHLPIKKDNRDDAHREKDERGQKTDQRADRQGAKILVGSETCCITT
jgi:hypothetical protein